MVTPFPILDLVQHRLIESIHPCVERAKESPSHRVRRGGEIVVKDEKIRGSMFSPALLLLFHEA